MSSLNLAMMLNGRTRRVSHVVRCSGVPKIRSELVAEHSYYTTYYSYLLARDLMTQGIEVDIGKLLSRSVVHDLDESVTGDVVRGVKYRDHEMKSKWDNVANEVVKDIGDELGIDIFEDWSTAKDHSVEGQILKFADLVSVTAYFMEELECGNRHMLVTLKENFNFISEWYRSGDIIPEIRQYVMKIRTLIFQVLGTHDSQGELVL